MDGDMLKGSGPLGTGRLPLRMGGGGVVCRVWGGGQASRVLSWRSRFQGAEVVALMDGDSRHHTPYGLSLPATIVSWPPSAARVRKVTERTTVPVTPKLWTLQEGGRGSKAGQTVTQSQSQLPGRYTATGSVGGAEPRWASVGARRRGVRPLVLLLWLQG